MRRAKKTCSPPPFQGALLQGHRLPVKHAGDKNATIVVSSTNAFHRACHVGHDISFGFQLHDTRCYHGIVGGDILKVDSRCAKEIEQFGFIKLVNFQFFPAHRSLRGCFAINSRGTEIFGIQV